MRLAATLVAIVLALAGPVSRVCRAEETGAPTSPLVRYAMKKRAAAEAGHGGAADVDLLVVEHARQAKALGLAEVYATDPGAEGCPSASGQPQ